jgi:hypothetical protein
LAPAADCLLAQIILIALPCDFASLTRKAFLTVSRQARSWAVSAVALLAPAKAVKATTAKIVIDFKTGFWTRLWVMAFLSDGLSRQRE